MNKEKNFYKGPALKKTYLKHILLILSLIFVLPILPSCIEVDEIMLAAETLQPEISQMLPDEGETVTVDESAAQACIPQGEPQRAEVERVVDGDTIQVRIGSELYKVRYIGVNTPETVHPDKDVEYFGEEASLQNHKLMEGKTVLLYKDVSETDQYGRLLRYVVTEEGLFVNYNLVRYGFAQVVSFPPDTACLQSFREAETMAREAGLGMWTGASAEVLSDGGQALVSITELVYNGSKGENEPDEYVQIQNSGSALVNLDGWTLQDAGQNIFIFPAYELQPGETCRVYTNEEHAEWCGFSFGQADSAVWNNGGDTATLRDAQGAVVDWETY